MDLKEMEILGGSVDRHWYYTSKSRAVHKILGGINPKSILDVGAGSGYFSRQLIDTHHTIKRCVCVDTSYDTNSSEIIGSTKIDFVQCIGETDADLVILMDVLEHVDDDIGMLSEYVEKAAPETLFLISVPAFEFLWSNHDIYLEHKRRYTLKMIERVAKGSSLEIVRSSYFFGSVLPIVLPLRIIQRIMANRTPPKSQLIKHSKIVNYILSGLCRLEIAIFKYNKFAGLSVFCLAKKI